MSLTRADKELPMGEFSPLWEKSSISFSKQRQALDIPLVTQYGFRVVTDQIIEGKNQSCYSYITEKLVFIKDQIKGQAGLYKMQIIPDYDYAKRNKRNLSGKFTNFGDKKGFCGLILYYAIDGRVPLRADYYQAGQVISSISAFTDDFEQYKNSIAKLSRIPSSMKIQRSVNVATRSGSENDWDDWDGGSGDGDGDWWDFDGYKDIGNGFYTDNDGNIFWDSNGDGKPDSMWIDPAETTENRPDPPGWDPDPDPNPTPETPEPPYEGPGEGGTGTTPKPHPDPEDEDKPCSDLLNHKANPMMEMKIAPSAGWNYRGGLYGPTRNSGTKNHDGIDLAGKVGTPIYAMFDGTVSSRNYVKSRLNRDSNGNYPKNYTGDRDGAGNRITITSNIRGQQVDLGYWHLQAGNPIAINPRTHEPFQPGDMVYSGEIIGYLGISGNAYNVPYPHLHLQARINGEKADPSQFLNANISLDGKTVTTPCDK